MLPLPSISAAAQFILTGYMLDCMVALCAVIAP